MRIGIYGTGGLVALLLSIGCSNQSHPSPLAAENWKPSAIGGPVEVRSLPPASQVFENYNSWRGEDERKKARVYEITLQGRYQTGFSHKITSADAPFGKSTTTWASFIYEDPVKGYYRMLWHKAGKWDTEFLKLGERSATVWVVPLASDEPGYPKLQMVAFEGMASNRLIAEAGIRK